jgi:acetolactate synthase-1/2/3 large subunit
MLLCQHEKVAVQIAHGYAKACGEPLCVIVHNVVGLLHATMGIYYAYTDRAPCSWSGATWSDGRRQAPPACRLGSHRECAGQRGARLRQMGLSSRRHPGRARQFRARYSIMMSEPQGPIYLCYDAGLQEAQLTETVRLPDPASVKRPSKIAPDMKALDEIADRLVAAEWPVLLPQYVGRVASGFRTWWRSRKQPVRPFPTFNRA